MIFSRLKSIHKNQKGFTLIELIVAIAITALIIGVIAISIFQVFIVNALSSNHMKAVRQVQNAGYWISRDTQMAQDVSPTVDADGFPLNVTWKDWDTNLHQVTYTLLGNGELERSYWFNGAATSNFVVAQYIESITVDPIPFSGTKLTLTVTATVGTWPQTENENRVYEIVPRPA